MTYGRFWFRLQGAQQQKRRHQQLLRRLLVLRYLRVPLNGHYKGTIRVPLKGHYKGTIRVAGVGFRVDPVDDINWSGVEVVLMQGSELG